MTRLSQDKVERMRAKLPVMGAGPSQELRKDEQYMKVAFLQANTDLPIPSWEEITSRWSEGDELLSRLEGRFRKIAGQKLTLCSVALLWFLALDTFPTMDQAARILGDENLSQVAWDGLHDSMELLLTVESCFDENRLIVPNGPSK